MRVSAASVPSLWQASLSSDVDGHVRVDQQRRLAGVVNLVHLAIDDAGAVAVGAAGGRRSPACTSVHHIAGVAQDRQLVGFIRQVEQARAVELEPVGTSAAIGQEEIKRRDAQCVVVGAAQEGNRAAIARQRVVTGAADESLRRRAAGQRVVAGRPQMRDRAGERRAGASGKWAIDRFDEGARTLLDDRHPELGCDGPFRPAGVHYRLSPSSS